MNRRLPWALIGLVALGAGPLSAASAQQARPVSRSPAAAAPTAKPSPAAATVGLPSATLSRVIDWIKGTRDNHDQPFIVVDKVAAQLVVFDATGRPLASGPVLIGTAKGDESAPGIGNRELSRIPPAQRTTPSGRFPARMGPAVGYKEPVLWVDYATAVAMHPVITSNPGERRMARLQSPTEEDNRITFGCINVDRKLFETIIKPLFAKSGGVVYVMPEKRALNTVFAGMTAEVPKPRQTFAQAFAPFRLQAPAVPTSNAAASAPAPVGPKRPVSGVASR